MEIFIIKCQTSGRLIFLFLMNNWILLVIEGSTHLVNLGSKIIDVKGFGRFPSKLLHGKELNEEFELFDKKAKLINSNQSDFYSNLKRGPQIISPKDAAWIIYKSGISAGDTVIEAGSGSGALTLSLVQAISPNGKVITFENNSKHFKIANRNIKMSPWSDSVDIRKEELSENTEAIDASSVILDLPKPWTLVKWSTNSLKIGGVLICYLPTVNQVQTLLETLGNWEEIEIIENIQRSWQSKVNALRPQSNMIGHTGFIVSARWLGK